MPGSYEQVTRFPFKVKLMFGIGSARTPRKIS